MAKNLRGTSRFWTITSSILSAGIAAVLCATSAHAAVGRTAGSFNVSPAGTASYNIPIFTPPGPRGVQPSIALTYSSGAGVGTVGRGWSIAGLSAVSRCNKTVAQDGTASGVLLQVADAYCLNGNRLRRQSGTYGQSGSVYATEIADFSHITADGTAGYGPASWIVKGKDGLTYTYGATSDSRVLADGTSTAHAWMVNQIQDRAGNKILFTYKSPDANTTGTTHPVAIYWTQTSAGSGSYLYSMEFAYGSNAPQSSYTGFVAGTVVRDTDLLTSISVKVSGTVKKKYVLGYDTSPTTGAKRLTSVQECSDAAQSDCLSATAIEYQNGTAGADTSTLALNLSGSIYNASGRYDFNGDGLRDIAYRRTGEWRVRFASATSGYSSEFSTGVSEFNLMAGDPFGNGRAVLMGQSSGTWYSYSWTGSSFTPSSTGVSTASTLNNVSLTDVDGDGREDLAYVSAFTSSTVTISTRASTSSGSTPAFASAATFTYTPSITPPPGFVIGSGITAALVTPTSAFSTFMGGYDADGDGRQDLMAGGLFQFCIAYTPYCGDFPFSAALLSRNSLQYTVSSSGNWYQYPTHINSDRCVDGYGEPNGLWRSNCGGSPGPSMSLGGDPLYGMADWNGDGRQDALVLPSGASTLKVRLITGEAAGSAQETGISPGSACTLIVTDSNADGLEEVGCMHAGVDLQLYAHYGATIKPDRAVKFTDGFGVEQTINYVFSTHGAYTPYSTATYPYVDVTDERLLVGSVVSTDGIGGTFTTTYAYHGGVENVQGRGFMGFEKVESVDSRNGVKRVQKFKREFPYAGMLIEESIYQSAGGALISSRTITPSEHLLDSTPYSERHFPYPLSSVADLYEVGGAKNSDWITRTTVSNTFDSSGNQTASTTTVTDKDTSSPLYTHYWIEAATASFTPNATYWCLGLPTATAVTSSSSVSGETTVTRSKGFTPDYINCRHDAESTGSGNRQVDTAYGYSDAFGNVTSISVTGRNPNSSSMSARTATIGFGTTGQFPVSETNALSQTTTRTFHSTFGSLLTETDPNGILVADSGYDAFGRVTRSNRADGTATVTAYYLCAATSACENGDPSSGVVGINKLLVYTAERDVSDAMFSENWTYLDLLDRPIVNYSRQMISGGWSRTGRQFDSMGRLYRETAPCYSGSCGTAYWATRTYDLLGRIATQSRPQSQSVSTPVTATYGYAGRTQAITDPQGKVTTKILDVKGQMRRSQDHNSYYQEFGYDAAGSLKQVSDSLSNTLFSATYSYGIKPFQDSTTDMDLGGWSYTYNSLGELTAWSDAKSQSFSNTYDALSRVTSRTEAEGTTTFTFGSSAGSHNIGRLAGTSMTGYDESLTYDSVGRLSVRSITTDLTYDIDYAYTNQGLLDSLTYPASTSSTRVKVKYGYDYGILKSVTDWTSGSAGTVYWTANAQNVRGQTTQETLGNGVVTNRAFDAVTGWSSSIQSGVSGGTALQNHSYLYDLVGNVTQRQENTQGLTEDFYYDNLYRLDYSQLNSSTNLDMTYDAMGNITNRTDVNGNASWTYHGTKKHAVASTGSGGAAYSYDANGNMISRNGQTISWTSYNYPTALATATESSAFYYGPDRQYYKQVYTGPVGTETTHYVGGVLEKVVAGGTTDWRHYIHADGQVVAIVSRHSSAGNAVYYPLEDVQGGGSVLTNSSGTNLVRQSYNAFGLPRDGADWDGAVPSGDLTTINSISRRGYTGHSMLGSMGLIHMNGRVQDAVTGRFLSADPNIPNPGFTQSYNRYAYVNNNPMSFVDPSGFGDTPNDSAGPLESNDLIVEGRHPEDPFLSEIRRRLDASCRWADTPLCRDANGWMDAFSRQWMWNQEQSARDQENRDRAAHSSRSSGVAVTSPTNPAATPQGNPVTQGLARDLDDYAGKVTDGDWWGAIKSLFTMNKNVWKNSYSTKEGAVLTTMSMVPFVGFESTVFKTGHYAARLGEAGLDVARTEAAVGAALNSVRADIAVMADVRGRMVVDGVLVEYGARVLPNGTLNVGTIFPVK